MTVAQTAAPGVCEQLCQLPLAVWAHGCWWLIEFLASASRASSGSERDCGHVGAITLASLWRCLDMQRALVVRNAACGERVGGLRIQAAAPP